MKAAQAVEALAALAHESRLAVFRSLVQHEPHGACPSDLIAELGIAPTLLSFHLKALLGAGLVSSQQHGRFVRYRASIDRTEALAAYLLEHCCSRSPQPCAPTGCGSSEIKAMPD